MVRCTSYPQQRLYLSRILIRGVSKVSPDHELSTYQLYRWVMHRTGKYRSLNLIFGLFPFVATILLSLMREDSPDVQLWFSIVSFLPQFPCPNPHRLVQLPMGFGNAVVLQTMLSTYPDASLFDSALIFPSTQSLCLPIYPVRFECLFSVLLPGHVALTKYPFRICDGSRHWIRTIVPRSRTSRRSGSLVCSVPEHS